jgi:hypothetical protein
MAPSIRFASAARPLLLRVQDTEDIDGGRDRAVADRDVHLLAVDGSVRV